MYTLLHNDIDIPIVNKGLTPLEIEYMLLFGPGKPNLWYRSEPNVVDFLIQSNVALYAIKSRGIQRLAENKKALTIYGLRIRGPIIIYDNDQSNTIIVPIPKRCIYMQDNLPDENLPSDNLPGENLPSDNLPGD